MNDIDEQFSIFERESIKIYCVDNRVLVIHNILYVFNCVFNLIFFNQLRDVDCSITFIFIDISIDINDIQITRRCDLNFLKLKKFVVCFSINTNVLNMWHERFDYLSHQNVIKLTRRVNIDFFKFFVSNFCVFCEKKNDKTKFHKTSIQFDRYSNDFIHENLMNFFFIDYNDARYLIC